MGVGLSLPLPVGGRTRSAVDVAEVRRRQAETAALTQVQRLLDDNNDAPAAAAQVRALMFIQRFRVDIDQRLAALDA